MGDIYSGAHGLDLARRAIAEMESRSVAPSPQNYCIWASHVSGQNPALSRDIAEIARAGTPLTDEIGLGLFDRHFAHVKMTDAIVTAGGQMHDQLAAAVTALEAAGRNTRAYEETLEGATGELSRANDPAALKRMVASLADATRQMQSHSDKLERRLHDTTREVDLLRTNLEKVREEALTDALTGVANRKRFDEKLERCILESKADGSALSLVFADIDHFKRFNDTWGHQTGDQIIRFVASAISRSAPHDALVARYGGEEFAVVMPGVNLDAAADLADRMRACVESKTLMRKSTNEDLGNVTISLGVAQLNPVEDPWELVERADKCLYASKSKGRNRVTTQHLLAKPATAA